MNASSPLPARNDPGSPTGDSVACWRLVAFAAPNDSLLLARALQKIAVPEIDLRAVQFETGGFGQPARLELTFCARADRARLAAVRLRKIIGMRQVALQPADNQQPGGGARLESNRVASDTLGAGIRTPAGRLA